MARDAMLEAAERRFQEWLASESTRLVYCPACEPETPGAIALVCVACRTKRAET